MRDKATAEADRAAGLKHQVPWRVIEVRAVSDRRIFVRFVDGIEGEVDLSRLIDGSQPGVFAALRNDELFKQVHVHEGAVTWPGELDLAPDAMHDAIKASGVWRPD